MGNLNLQEEKELAQVKHDLACQRDLTKTATDYALRGLHSLFLLNGAAAAAILSHGDKAMYTAGLTFAASAVIAVANIGCAYAVNYLYAERIKRLWAERLHKLSAVIATGNILFTAVAVGIASSVV